MCQAAKGDTLQENPSLPCRGLQVSVRMLGNLGWVLGKASPAGWCSPQTGQQRGRKRSAPPEGFKVWMDKNQSGEPDPALALALLWELSNFCNFTVPLYSRWLFSETSITIRH